ncbi:hypothetical protein SAMN05216462_1738 [Xylanibacter ruminicola]|uniref:Fimbrillin-A associated anchor protein Mfa1 and Mfa2 n=1 Tax=Xylanibacter ruminicola TaxID=839 RepID=A0A1H4C2Q9_XYLRU|nr:FimB/Mfa2 family fimbrial subunit [Xylanibacter ruminicola]SEA54617.1 hypothetical protein SAMN05216462_1738 [Xylanibacter ruminicola]
MKIQSIMLAGILLLAQSCGHHAEVENNPGEAKAPVRVHVSDFAFTSEPFPDAQTRADVDPNNYKGIQAIDIAIFAADQQVYAATQLKDVTTTYTTFGEFECSLPMGTYTMVAVARNKGEGDVFTITSPTQAAYTSDRARETFCCTQNITVSSTEPVDISPVMSRVMARFQLVSTDQMPSNAATIRTTYGAGSKSFNPTTGLATDDDGFTVTNTAHANTAGVLDVFSIVFLAANEETMPVTVEALDANQSVLISKTLPAVHFKRNQITKATGAMFTPGSSSFTFLLDTDWLPQENITF